jgi:signal transduction histidine kinase
MPGDRKQQHALVNPGAAVGLAGLIVALAVLSSRPVGEAPGYVDVYPAGGLPILWLLVRGARVISVDTAVLVAVLFGSNVLAGSDPDVAGVFAIANILQTVLAVLLLRRWCPQMWGCGGADPLDRPRVLARYGAALVLATAVGAAVAMIGVVAVEAHSTSLAGLLWFGRNLCSALIVVTLGLLLGQRASAPRPRPRLLGDAGVVELVAATAFTVGMYAVAFSFDDLPLAFPLLAATVWFGLRFSTVLSGAHSFLAGVATITLTVMDIGPFAAVERLDLGYLLAEFYVATIVITGLGLSTGRDERHALAAELRRTEEDAVYQASVRDAVIGSINEGLLVVDESGELLVHNDAAARMLGAAEGPLTTESRLVLTTWWADGFQMSDEDKPTVRALRGEAVHDAEVVVRVADAGDRVLNVSAIPLPRDEVRGRARALVLFRDVTTELAHREELAAFAGVVAHDLRNPLAAIDGWTEMIADELDAGALDAQLAREFVSRVRSSSRRMRELIKDLLAHATSSQRDLELSRVDVTQLVEEIAAARHAEGFVSCSPIPPVSADGVLVRQVLDNLIGNALKYVAPGVEPKITVHGCQSLPHLVTIQIADNGIGIPAGEREKIFDEFHRAHYRDYEGSGLGLSIVRRIITRHDGTIMVRANPAGQGSVFEFTLPSYTD